jgi:hypothetical protein
VGRTIAPDFYDAPGYWFLKTPWHQDKIAYLNVPLVASHQGSLPNALWSIPGFMHTWFCVTQLCQVALL